MLLVPEVLRHGQPGERHPHPGPGGLVHLSKHQGRLFNDPGLGHLPPQVAALPGALPHAGKNRVSAVLGGNIVDQLLDQHRFAHAGAAKQADLAAPGIGGQQVDDLDPCLKQVHHRALVGKAGGLAVDGPVLLGGYCSLAVDGIPQHIEHPAQHALPHRDGDGPAPGLHLHAPADPLAGGEHEAADGVPADVLGHLHDTLLTAHLQPQGVLDGGHLIPGELDVHHRSLDLCHRPFIFLHICTHLSGDVSPSALPGPGPRWRSL